MSQCFDGKFEYFGKCDVNSKDMSFADDLRDILRWCLKGLNTEMGLKSQQWFEPTLLLIQIVCHLLTTRLYLQILSDGELILQSNAIFGGQGPCL